jgi:imidazolonepropionase-like amidohydrolase
MAEHTTICNVRVLAVQDPGIPVSPAVDVGVEDGRIVSISPSAGVNANGIDGGGQFLLPGLVNAHDHLYSKELRSPTAGNDLRTMRQVIDRRDEALTVAVMIRNAWAEMAEGVLIVRDLGARHGANTRVAEIFSRRIMPGPVVVASGRPIVMTGGHVSSFGREADGPDECRKAVREQRKAGAGVIKIMASGGLSNFPHENYTVSEYTDEELVAIVGEAKKLGIPSCAHAFGADAVAGAVRAGVNSIEHGIHLTDEAIEMMIDNGTSYVPTMANMQRIASPTLTTTAGSSERAERFAAEVVAPQIDSVRRAIAASIRIGVGTDSTGTYLEEIVALQNAGMSTEHIIRAATLDGAAICHAQAGVILPGRPALFNLYASDPRDDVTALVEPTAVFVHDRFLMRDAILEMAGSGFDGSP